ncbi:MAG: hypothetical protein JRJ87_25085 [Deltaproteobacteria bacterium]|nr:hypothetical protein [Deltaproteobacteria bacterium]
MSKKILLGCLGLLLSLLMPSKSTAQSVTKVTIRNKDFEVVKILEKKTELAEFALHWEKKVKQKNEVSVKWLYKLDVSKADKGNRWLYDPAGWTRILSKKMTPIYKIASKEEFNKLLGIDDRPNTKSHAGAVLE